MTYYAVCEECGLVTEAERVNVDVGVVGHYHHCGYAHECFVHELYDDKSEALQAAFMEASAHRTEEKS